MKYMNKSPLATASLANVNMNLDASVVLALTTIQYFRYLHFIVIPNNMQKEHLKL